MDKNGAIQSKDGVTNKTLEMQMTQGEQTTTCGQKITPLYMDGDKENDA